MERSKSTAFPRDCWPQQNLRRISREDFPKTLKNEASADANVASADANVASARFSSRRKTENEVIATANQNEGKYQEASFESLVKNHPTPLGTRKREL